MTYVAIIRDIETDEEVHRIETDKTGSQLDRMLDGLYRKFDFDRFYIDEQDDAEASR